MSVAVAKPPQEPPPEFPARRLVRLPRPLRLYRGGSIAEPVVAYESWGSRNAADDNTVLLFTGLSPSAHAASSALDPVEGWWETMIGEARPIDTRRWHVVCVNSLGSPYGSSSPASIDPATGRPYGTAFPALSVEDMASAAHEALAALGIARVACVIGPSLGGMTALGYGVQYPEEVSALISISGAVTATAQAIALRALQREIVRCDPAWRDGSYQPGQGPRTGLKLARKLGTITYRGAREFDERFGRERVAAPEGALPDARPPFQIESYLDHQAQRFSQVFDANCFLALSQAMDEFDLAEHGGSLGGAFARFKAMRALVIGVETDILFPLHQQQAIGAGLKSAGADVEFHAFPSAAGHDSFLVDLPRFEAAIGDFLAGR
jgi:homoserine O-acetyltransferase